MRFHFIILGRLLAVVLFCSTPFLISPARAEMTSAPSMDTARILHLEGKIAVREPNSAEWKTPRQGTWVEKGSEIKTGDGSSCDIGLGEDHHSMVHMTENTRTILHTLDAEKIRVNLEEGSVFARVRDLKKGSTFEVASPTAVATARGTGWEQSVDEINVFESSVEVVGSSGEIFLVQEGFGIDVDDTGDLKEPEALPAEDKAEWENFETQADKVEAQEATLPADPGYNEETASANVDGAGDPSGDPVEDDPKPGMTGPNDPMHEPDSTEDPMTGPADGNQDILGDPEGPSAGETDPMENSFDSFGDGFGTEGFESPGDTTGGPSPEDYLGAAKEEQQATLPPPPFDPEGPFPPHCASQGGPDPSC